MNSSDGKNLTAKATFFTLIVLFLSQNLLASAKVLVTIKGHDEIKSKMNIFTTVKTDACDTPFSRLITTCENPMVLDEFFALNKNSCKQRCAQNPSKQNKSVFLYYLLA